MITDSVQTEHQVVEDFEKDSPLKGNLTAVDTSEGRNLSVLSMLMDNITTGIPQKRHYFNVLIFHIA